MTIFLQSLTPACANTPVRWPSRSRTGTPCAALLDSICSQISCADYAQCYSSVKWSCYLSFKLVTYDVLFWIKPLFYTTEHSLHYFSYSRTAGMPYSPTVNSVNSAFPCVTCTPNSYQRKQVALFPRHTHRELRNTRGDLKLLDSKIEVVN